MDSMEFFPLPYIFVVVVCLFGGWYVGGEVTGGSGSSISSWEFVVTQNMNRSINLCIQRLPLSLSHCLAFVDHCSWCSMFGL